MGQLRTVTCSYVGVLNLSFFLCRMVRTYKKKSDTMEYTEEDVARALLAIESGDSLRVAAARFKIPATSLYQRYVGRSRSPGKIGRKTALLRAEELALAQNLAALGDRGMAFDISELRDFVKSYLDKHHRVIEQFQDNKPGYDWARGFLNRNRHILSHRMCQNISRKRAAISERDVGEYFERLRTTLEGVPAANIINYDETNLTDDPKGKLQIFRRGIKHAERIINTTKSSTSIMFAVTAAGDVLQPYVVYKAERLQQAWILGGHMGTIYNRTSSGWFDSEVFQDWFNKVILRYCSSLPPDEPKVLLGDNLLSHYNNQVADLCMQHNIRLTFIPANSTHFLQPLDVSVYGPLKVQWRKIITAWKEGEGRHMACMPKWAVAPLLLSLMESMDDKWDPLAKAGFKACGIHPFNPTHVLSKMRKLPQDLAEGNLVSPHLLTYLQDKRETSVKHRGRGRGQGRGRGSRSYIPPGTSMSLQDLQDMAESGPSGTFTSSQRSPDLSSADDTDPDTEEEVISFAPSKRARRHLTFESDDTPDISVDDPEPLEDYAEDEDLQVKPGDYVLVKFAPVSKQVAVHFVGLVLSKKGNKWSVNYFRKADTPQELDPSKVLVFKQPDIKDILDTSAEDIVMKLELKEARKTVILFNNVFAGLLIR